TYTTRYFFDFFIHGKIAHSNQKKEAELDAMPPHVVNTLMMMFQGRLRGLCEVAQLQSLVIWYWLDEPTVPVPAAPQP
ncbi:MAG: hypothetical protein ACJAUC_002385, partial [Planctomycetota bacterium]